MDAALTEAFKTILEVIRWVQCSHYSGSTTAWPKMVTLSGLENSRNWRGSLWSCVRVTPINCATQDHSKTKFLASFKTIFGMQRYIYMSSCIGGQFPEQKDRGQTDNSVYPDKLFSVTSCIAFVEHGRIWSVDLLQGAYWLWAPVTKVFGLRTMKWPMLRKRTLGIRTGYIMKQSFQRLQVMEPFLSPSTLSYHLLHQHDKICRQNLMKVLADWYLRLHWLLELVARAMRDWIAIVVGTYVFIGS